MTRMLDAWHDRYHAEAPDFGCVYCQDELLAKDAEIHGEASVTLPLPAVEIDVEAEWGAWLEATYDPDNGPYDRLEDLL